MNEIVEALFTKDVEALTRFYGALMLAPPRDDRVVELSQR